MFSKLSRGNVSLNAPLATNTCVLFDNDDFDIEHTYYTIHTSVGSRITNNYVECKDDVLIEDSCVIGAKHYHVYRDGMKSSSHIEKTKKCLNKVVHTDAPNHRTRRALLAASTDEEVYMTRRTLRRRRAFERISLYEVKQERRQLQEKSKKQSRVARDLNIEFMNYARMENDDDYKNAPFAHMRDEDPIYVRIVNYIGKYSGEIAKAFERHEEYITMVSSTGILIYQLMNANSRVDAALAFTQYINVHGLMRYVNYFTESIQMVCTAFELCYRMVFVENDTIDRGIQMFSRILRSEVVEAFRNIVISVCALKFFDKKTAIAMYALFGKPSGMSITDMVEYLLQNLAKVITMFEKLASGCPFSEVFFSESPVDNLIDRIEQLLEYKVKLYTGVAVEGMMARSEFIVKGDEYLDASAHLLKNINPLLRNASKLNTITKALRRDVDELKLASDNSVRPVPFSIVLWGNPGVGKGKLINFFAAILAHVVGVPYTDGMIYHRVMSSQYWEGYQPRSQYVLHYTEVASASDAMVKTCGDEVIKEYNSVIDSQPFPADMAALDSKGKVYVRPWMVISDTNNESMNFKLLFNNPAAYMRRGLYVRPIPKAQFRKDGGMELDPAKSLADPSDILDRWTFEVYTYVAKSPKVAEKVPIMTGAETDDIYKLTAVMTNMIKGHIMSQENVMKRFDNYDITKYLNPPQFSLDELKVMLESEVLTAEKVAVPERAKHFGTCKLCMMISDSQYGLCRTCFPDQEDEKMMLSQLEAVDVFLKQDRSLPKLVGQEMRGAFADFYSSIHPTNSSDSKEDHPSHISTTCEKCFKVYELDFRTYSDWYCDECVPYNVRTEADSGLREILQYSRAYVQAHYYNVVAIMEEHVFYPRVPITRRIVAGFTETIQGVCSWSRRACTLWARLWFAITCYMFAQSPIFDFYWRNVVLLLWAVLGLFYPIMSWSAFFCWLTMLFFLISVDDDIFGSLSSTVKRQAELNLIRIKYECQALFTFGAVKAVKSTFERNKLLFVTAGSALITGLGIYCYRSSKKEKVQAQYEDTYAASSMNDIERLVQASDNRRRIPNKREHNVWNNAVQMDNPTLQRGNFDETYRSVMRNSRRVFIGSGRTYILGICKNLAIINTHAIPNGKFSMRVANSASLDLESVERYNEVVVEPEDCAHLGNDITLLRLRTEMFVDIREKVLTSSRCASKSYEGMMLLQKMKVVINTIPLNMNNDSGSNITVQHTVSYEFKDHSPGCCGLPVIVLKANTFSLIGIHAAGTENSSTCYAVMVDKEILCGAIDRMLHGNSMINAVSQSEVLPLFEAPTGKSIFNYMDAQRVTLLGKSEGKVLINQKSKLEKTPYYKEMQDEFERMFPDHIFQEFGRPLMRPIYDDATGTAKCPYRRGLEKMNAQKKYIDQALVDKVVEIYTDHLINNLKAPTLNPTTLEAAVNGALNDAFLRRMNLSTSAGYGLKGKKRDYFIRDENNVDHASPELVRDVYEIINSYLKGESAHAVYTAQLKDEPRTIEKVNAGKTRLFFMQPLALLIAQRMFLSPFYTMCCEQGDVIRTAVGINMHSQGGNIRRKLLKLSQNIFEGDYGNFDQSMPVQISQAASTVVYNVLQHFGYNDISLTIVENMLADNMFVNVEMCRDVFTVLGLQPSGKYATAEDNSIKGVIMLMLFWYSHEKLSKYDFFEHFVVLTYGDDVLGSVSDTVKEWCTIVEYKKFCEGVLGIEFTAPDKSAVTEPFTTIDKASFLKRKFVWKEDVGDFVAALDLSSILKTMTWTLPSGSVSKSVQQAGAATSVLYELSLHLDERAFDEMRGFILQSLQNAFPYDTFELPTYWTILEGIFGELSRD